MHLIINKSNHKLMYIFSSIFQTGQMKEMMSDIEIMALLVACLSHDLDHRGTNNSFQTK